MDKINPNKVVAVGWLLTGVFVCLVGSPPAAWR
jgi:AAHS family 4-hydroxybenzoate transporter-like MFS transporter